jgi:hypothetical protein
VNPGIKKTLYIYLQSEAGNEKYFYELHARRGLRFIMRLQEDIPTKSYLAFLTDSVIFLSILRSILVRIAFLTN